MSNKHPNLNHEPIAERRAYILRLWRKQPQTPWHVLFRAIDESESYQFSTIKQLIDHLETLDGRSSSAPE